LRDCLHVSPPPTCRTGGPAIDKFTEEECKVANPCRMRGLAAPRLQHALASHALSA
jgi:hypothetical protein